MFEHYLSNKNECATVAPKSKIRELNKGSAIAHTVSNLFFYLSFLKVRTVASPHSTAAAGSGRSKIFFSPETQYSSSTPDSVISLPCKTPVKNSLLRERTQF